MESNRRSFLKIVGSGIVAAPFLGAQVMDARALDLSGKPFKDSLKGTKYEGQATISPEVQHPYFTDSAWLGKVPDFFEYNAKREDTGAERPENNLIKHEIHLDVGGNRAEVSVNFINKLKHPHQVGHWWSWIELWDKENDPAWIFIHQPAGGEDRWGPNGVNFAPDIFLKNKIKGNLVRVRAYCVTHGLYTHYFKI